MYVLWVFSISFFKMSILVRRRLVELQMMFLMRVQKICVRVGGVVKVAWVN